MTSATIKNTFNINTVFESFEVLIKLRIIPKSKTKYQIYTK